MHDSRFKELVNKSLAGEISEKDKLELDIYLKNQPEARKEYEDTIDLDRRLREMPTREAPEDLKSSIMEQVRNLPRKQTAAEPSFLGKCLHFFAFPKTRYFLAYAAGVVSVLLIVTLVPGITDGEKQFDSLNLTGSLSQNYITDQDRAFFSQPINETGISGMARLLSEDNLLILVLNLTPELNAHFNITVNFENLRLIGALADKGSLELPAEEEHRVSFSCDGRDKYTVWLRTKDQKAASYMVNSHISENQLIIDISKNN